ncbi:MAG: glycine dehydrogenase, partial [Planctomycetes bacterium]|nr:glycine dehydrogenase [Planctomycetota bacterium]
MSYLFSTSDEQRQMLERIGAGSIEALLDQIPKSLQLGRSLTMPPALTELELEQHMRQLAARNVGSS